MRRNILITGASRGLGMGTARAWAASNASWSTPAWPAVPL